MISVGGLPNCVRATGDLVMSAGDLVMSAGDLVYVVVDVIPESHYFFLFFILFFSTVMARPSPPLRVMFDENEPLHKKDGVIHESDHYIR